MTLGIRCAGVVIILFGLVNCAEKKYASDYLFIGFCNAYAENFQKKVDKLPTIRKLLSTVTVSAQNPQELKAKRLCFANRLWIEKAILTPSYRERRSPQFEGFAYSVIKKGLRPDPARLLQSSIVTSPIVIDQLEVRLNPNSTLSYANMVFPLRFDWREQGILKEPLRQGECGSCYAFAVTAAIEAMMKIRGEEIPRLSQQELIDCIRPYNGCAGAGISESLDYIQRNGIEYLENYPYRNASGACKVFETTKLPNYGQMIGNPQLMNIPSQLFRYWWPRPFSKVRTEDLMASQSRTLGRPTKKRFFGLAGYKSINPPNVFNVFEALKGGPLIAKHLYNKNLNKFTGETYFGENCHEANGNYHIILIVGYDIQVKFPHFLIKNSWGPDWADKGFYRFAIGPLTASNPGLCDLFKHVMYQPIIKGF